MTVLVGFADHPVPLIGLSCRHTETSHTHTGFRKFDPVGNRTPDLTKVESPAPYQLRSELTRRAPYNHKQPSNRSFTGGDTGVWELTRYCTLYSVQCSKHSGIVAREKSQKARRRSIEFFFFVVRSIVSSISVIHSSSSHAA